MNDPFVNPSTLCRQIEAQTITIQGVTYTSQSFLAAFSNEQPEKGLSAEVIRFLLTWFSSCETMEIQTSGSTGKPARYQVPKSAMIESAINTCRFLELNPREKALICLPMNYIAAQMMVVRALVAGLDIYLTEPVGKPLQHDNNRYRISSMVPLQVYNTLQEPDGKQKLEQTAILLIGGGPLDIQLENRLKELNNELYMTYGMAETLSHVALRRLNGPDASSWYRPMPDVDICLNEAGCLQIEAPWAVSHPVVTKDMGIQQPDGRFSIIGRSDNLLSTGGMKVHAETLEAIFSQWISVPFAITSLPDAKFGERIILVSEQPVNENLLSRHQPNWQIPKQFVVVPSLPRTQSGKIDRYRLKAMITDVITPSAAR